MKRRAVFLFSCFLVFLNFSCAFHPIDPGEEENFLPPKTIKEKIQEELDNLPPYKLYMHIPIVDAWENANYSGFDYLAFFKKVCQPENQIKGDGAYDCVLPNKNTKLSITENGTTIIIFKELELTTTEGTKTISGVWEITGTATLFSVSKYERSCIEDDCTLKIVDYKYSGDNRKTLFSANGVIGLPYGGRYYFYFDDFYYGACPNKPVGRMHFQAGTDKVEAIFFEDTECDPCVPIQLNDVYFKYSYCHDWKMKNLFSTQ